MPRRRRATATPRRWASGSRHGPLCRCRAPASRRRLPWLFLEDRDKKFERTELPALRRRGSFQTENLPASSAASSPLPHPAAAGELLLDGGDFRVQGALGIEFHAAIDAAFC